MVVEKILKTIKVKVSVNCIIEQGKKFLLVKQARPARARNKWSLPGGKLEKGESFVKAVRREAKEEVGLIVTKIRYVGCKQEYPFETIKHFFAVKTKNNNITLSKNEILEAKWFALKEIGSMRKHLRKSWVFDALKEYNKKGEVANNLKLPD